MVAVGGTYGCSCGLKISVLGFMKGLVLPVVAVAVAAPLGGKREGGGGGSGKRRCDVKRSSAEDVAALLLVLVVAICSPPFAAAGTRPSAPGGGSDDDDRGRFLPDRGGWCSVSAVDDDDGLLDMAGPDLDGGGGGSGIF